MPAIIMHAGAGVLLIIMTTFALPKQNNKEKNYTKNKSPLPHIHCHNLKSTTQGARDGVAVAAAVVMLTCARNMQ